MRRYRGGSDPGIRGGVGCRAPSCEVLSVCPASRELAGHVDPAMVQIYSHLRLAAKRVAVAAVKAGQSEGGVTSQTTSQKPFPALPLKWKLLKKMVGAPRFELGTSWSRTKRATRLRYAPTKTVTSG